MLVHNFAWLLMLFFTFILHQLVLFDVFVLCKLNDDDEINYLFNTKACNNNDDTLNCINTSSLTRYRLWLSSAFWTKSMV